MSMHPAQAAVMSQRGTPAARPRAHRRWRGIAALALSLQLAACEGSFDIDWSYAVPDTVTLYSLSRQEYVGFASVFSFVSHFAGAIEEEGMTGLWDLGFVEEDAGWFFLLPGGLDGLRPQAIMRALPGYSWDDVRLAPTAGYDSAAVPLHVNLVYVLRTRFYDTGAGSICHHYAKVEPVEVNDQLGVLRFRYVMNPNCGVRELVP